MATETASTPGVPPQRSGGRRTIGALWREALSTTPRSNPAYLVEDGGVWKEVSWAEAARCVEDLAHGLLALGIGKGDVVGIIAATRLEWALVDLALAEIGAISAPIYPNSSAKACAYALQHSESVAVVVDDESQRQKVGDVRSELPRLRHVIGFDELDELASRGRGYAHEHPDALRLASDVVGEEDIFTYQYTSGTTGPPRACMMRHRNYYEMARTVDRLDRFISPEDVMLLWLPLAHNFGRLMHLAAPYVGFTVAFVPDPLRLPEVMPQIRPTVLPSAPRVFEKTHTAVKAQFETATGMRRRLIEWALRVGYRASPYKRRGRPLPRGLAAQHRVADRLVYTKVKERLGGRLRIGVSGAAPLSQEIAEFFHALDILIIEGYGLSECTTACTVNRVGNVKFGTVGQALPGFEVRTDDDGEVLIRSETIFAGYYRDEEATREVLTDDGWLRSGDVGELDDEGFLRITDRKKDIIVTAGGKNVAPQNIENALKAAPLVSQALVVGDRRNYVAALVTLDEDETAKWGRANGLDGNVSELAQNARLRAEVEQIVENVNRELSRPEQVKRFTVLSRDFSADRDELTPTLKLKRRVCEAHFADEIEALYR
jgi:long-chain acyl-CoA synthetase